MGCRRAELSTAVSRLLGSQQQVKFGVTSGKIMTTSLSWTDLLMVTIERAHRNRGVLLRRNLNRWRVAV